MKIKKYPDANNFKLFQKLRSKVILFIFGLIFGIFTFWLFTTFIETLDHPLLHSKINNYMQTANQQWKENRSILDNLEALQFDPKLGLYSKIESEKLEDLEQVKKKISQSIDYNGLLLNELKIYPSLSKIKNELLLQNYQLKIAYALNNVLLFRKEHRFEVALAEINNVFPLIKMYTEHYKKTPYPTGKSPTSFLTLAHYQKAKIHRMIAGLDLKNLKIDELKKSEQNYLIATELDPKNSAIHSSLGYLYNDMGKIAEAKTELEKANYLHPNFPDYIHGIAYTYYTIEKTKHENQEKLDQINLTVSNEAFERAIQRFNELGSINSRIYLDHGKLLLLMNNQEQALDAFNKGLSMDPNHSLLLLERGLLFASLGRNEEALNDLKRGKIVTSFDFYANENFANIIKILKKNIPIQYSSESQKENSNILVSQMLNRQKLIKNLGKFNQYSQRTKKHPTCYIAYAWDNKAHEQWVEQFAKDLEYSGCHVLLDRWFTRKGQDTMAFVEKILSKETDYIIVVGSKRFLEKYNLNKDFSKNESFMGQSQKEHVLKIETRLLNHIIGFSQSHSDRVVPILIEGEPEQSLPPLMRIKNISDFAKGDYTTEITELIRDLYRINPRNQILANI